MARQPHKQSAGFALGKGGGMKADLTYRRGRTFTTFLPETPAGEAAWRDMAEATAGTGKVFNAEAPRIIAALRAAGYVVHRVKPGRAEIDGLLAELSA